MVKKDWELGYFLVFKKEEEKRVVEEEDEVLYIYFREDVFQVKKNKVKRRFRLNSYCFSNKKVLFLKELKEMFDLQVVCRGVVKNNRDISRILFRVSSRSSSCSSLKRIIRRIIFIDKIQSFFIK